MRMLFYSFIIALSFSCTPTKKKPKRTLLEMIESGDYTVTKSSSNMAPSHSGINISRKKVQKAINKNHTAFKNCFENEKKKNPKLAGKVTLSFDSINDGETRVLNPLVQSSTLNNQKVEGCLIKEIQKVKIPDIGKNQRVKVIYPFNFQ